MLCIHLTEKHVMFDVICDKSVINSLKLFSKVGKFEI